MHAIELKDPAGFGNEFLRLTLLQGFQSLTKRDLELLIFVLLERDGAVDRGASNATVALQLRVTPAKVKGLRRDGYARWRALVPEDADAALQRIVATVLTEANLRSGAKHVSERSRKDGFLAVRIEHPDDAQRFEQAILEVGALPVYERNREVVAVRFDTLLKIAERWGFLQPDPQATVAALKKLAPTSEEVADLLKKDVAQLRWDDVRRALNSLGAKAVSSTVEGGLKGLLKLAFPFIPG
ncbi:MULTISPECIES: hypothetical protein [Stenotrophomonas]|jgi:hypothetical protein|uniref:Uncharacterized protein n=1 Tax=Stenotrophomonas acidaminiphila TaxID=128780 RepID=A0A0R0DGH7_9GAMM|nr:MULTISPECIES: hypothetical protein [Stenotrophomonas]ODU44387.1 MAG: hypothetical protein ABS96_19660 [Xanthomonadaceae bacterium SCN 69-123]OJY80697.1 MAG: hypothetical protein BGP18_13220 [Stenotrophomonas sp. 69-14]OZB53092.1 MAG: hypothetical protein B7X38_06170 [Stenotrophomonas sp. 14-69-23]ALJ29288.1 hypothetical protein AOT14_29360 [Stenotrophomonas acidaminiphila]KRG80891.1 hypothetical protein ABB33_17480 [Stenotrophomonas acidaminiphila]